MQQTAGVILSLDVGDRRVGVAVANPIARMASPLTTLQNDEKLIDNILTLVREHQATTVVIGLPRGLEGQETAQTEKVRAWADEFKKQAQLNVELQDEAVTSVKAEELLKLTKKSYTKEDIDMYAAAEILQDYIDNQAKRILA